MASTGAINAFPGCSAVDFVHDCLRGLCPREQLSMKVMVGNVRADRALELTDAAKGFPRRNALRGDVREESLDGVEQRRSRRRKVDVVARVRREPILHDGMLPRGVVVDVNVEPLRDIWSMWSRNSTNSPCRSRGRQPVR
jgi:hypothetical protein